MQQRMGHGVRTRPAASFRVAQASGAFGVTDGYADRCGARVRPGCGASARLSVRLFWARSRPRGSGVRERVETEDAARERIRDFFLEEVPGLGLFDEAGRQLLAVS